MFYGLSIDSVMSDNLTCVPVQEIDELFRFQMQNETQINEADAEGSGRLAETEKARPHRNEGVSRSLSPLRQGVSTSVGTFAVAQ